MGRDGPYEKGSLRRGPGCLTGPFTEKDDEKAYGKAGPLREAPDREGRSLREGPVLTGESLTGMAPFTKKDGLWEATGRDFTRIGREFPLVCRRPKKAVFS